MIELLCLEHHNSELFSFLDPQCVSKLREHRAANVPLWTFGDTIEGKLRSVSVWNGPPFSFAWTAKPTVDRSAGWSHYGSFTCADSLIEVSAITLVRHYFVQGYPCALDLVPWIRPADPTLQRLRYIRGYGGKSVDSPEWLKCKRSFSNGLRIY